MEREIISFDYAIKTPEQRAEYERNKIIDMSQKSQLYTAELRVLEKTVIRGHNKGHSKLTVGILRGSREKIQYCITAIEKTTIQPATNTQ